ncbi:MAG TPA: class I SAM-dependent methyltransferase [Candidatus Acidoferrum sp.]|jgi:ubiquinone/menaquinone biosynthesis C-methylase UbiE|nr:class I SAM-dependent methyltransferase [Candidatus Acidoferrum sp.]
MLKELVHEYFPPKVTRGIDAIALALFRKGIVYWRRVPLPAILFRHAAPAGQPEGQNLGVYWSNQMAMELETWGEGTAWREVLFFLSLAKGRILDIACGTGKVMELLSHEFPECDLHGIDISDLLIGKARERGIASEKLRVGDAMKTGYPDDYFECSYSIGSLEHFTEDGIDAFLRECARITRLTSFHMIPTSRSRDDDGWITTTQSYFNNSPAWWMKKFEMRFERVNCFDSQWGTIISVGKWFVCNNPR